MCLELPPVLSVASAWKKKKSVLTTVLSYDAKFHAWLQSLYVITKHEYLP